MVDIIARDFLRPPSILEIDTTYYHRQVGDVLRLTVKDDVEVTGVTVKLTRHTDGTLIEEVAAVFYGPHWRTYRPSRPRRPAS